MTDANIHVYGQSANGGHAVGIDFGNLRVLVTPSGPEDDAAAVKLAQTVAAAGELADRLRTAADDNARLRAAVEREQAAVRHMLSGKRRFFGVTLMLPELPGDWTGPVWLHDPDKRDRGMSLRFPSLRAVRETYPELWVVGVLDGGVLLDAAPLMPREEP